MRDFSEIGALVKERRNGLGLNIRDAADQIGVPFSTLSRVERGNLPDLTNFRRMVEWLGMSADEFFSPQVVAESTMDAVATHLNADPALSAEAASKIADIVIDLYRNLAKPQRRMAFHLRAAKTFEPNALSLLTDLVDDLEAALLARHDEG